MEFAQYYRQDNSIEHLGYPIFPTSSEPSVVTQQQHYMPTPAPRSTMNNFNAPASNTTPKEAEEPDTSSRPRLTTEQTNILEEHFQRESKPVTDVKKQLAAQIGLPLDKVNNWYQNRRAKAKHLKKQEILEVLPLNFQHNAWNYTGFSSPDLQMPLEYQSSGLLAVSNQSASQPFTTPIDDSPLSGSRLEKTLASWENDHSATKSTQPGFINTDIQAPTAISPYIDSMLQNYITTSEVAHANQNSASSFSEWENSQAQSATWTPSQRIENPFGAEHGAQQQTESSVLSSHDQAQHDLNDLDLMSMYSNGLETLQAPDGSPVATISPLAIHDSPTSSHGGTSSIYNLPNQLPARRGSGSSELAHNFDTIHLQRVLSQQNSDEEVFKTPAVPDLNLAARRKRQRPAALGTVTSRSCSYTGPETSSPSTKSNGLAPSLSVRRIKSTGNNLNVISGRVQKSGVATSQRSPLSFQTFHEAEAFNRIHNLTDHTTNASPISSKNSFAPPTPMSPSGLGGEYFTWNKESVESQLQLHQNRSRLPFSHERSQSDADSPPKTPYNDMAYFQPDFTTPPQSAPAHLTTFQHALPTFHTVQQGPMAYAVPSTSLAESYAYYPAAGLPQQHASPMAFNAHYMPHVYSHPPPAYVHGSPPMAGHNMFYANSAPPPAKEMEFVLQTFPEPEVTAQAPKEPHRPKDYIFQNTGPKDF